MDIYIEKISEDAVMPFYAHEGDAGMDLCANEDVMIAPGETKLVPTGLKMAIPVGYEVQIRPRSGISLKTKLRVANAPGTIDSGYRGEVCVIMDNISAPNTAENRITIEDKGQQGTYLIKKGNRIAQMVIASVEKGEIIECQNVESIDSDRGVGGFGSSGV